MLAALCLGPLFSHLPRFALAAVVILAVARLLEPRPLVALCRADTLDGLAALITFSVTVMFGPERGILAGIAAAALCLLWRTRRVPPRRVTIHEQLWRPAGTPESATPVCLVLRPSGSVLYPHAEAIRDEALRLVIARGLPVVLDLSARPSWTRTARRPSAT